MPYKRESDNLVLTLSLASLAMLSALEGHASNPWLVVFQTLIVFLVVIASSLIIIIKEWYQEMKALRTAIDEGSADFFMPSMRRTARAVPLAKKKKTGQAAAAPQIEMDFL